MYQELLNTLLAPSLVLYPILIFAGTLESTYLYCTMHELCAYLYAVCKYMPITLEHCYTHITTRIVTICVSPLIMNSKYTNNNVIFIINGTNFQVKLKVPTRKPS